MSGFLAGAIVAKLILDKTGWNASVDGVKADEKTLTTSAKNIDQSFTQLGTRMALTGAAMTGAMLASAQAAGRYGDQMDELSQKVGIGTDSLQAMQLIAVKSGTSLEGMATGLGILSRNMVDAAGGSAQALQKFELLGITVFDTNGKLKETDVMLIELAERFSTMPDGPIKTAAAMELLGRSGKDMIPFLNEGADGMKRQMERARELGLVMSKEAIKASRDFSDSQDELKLSLTATSRTIGQTMLPIITDFMKKATDIVSAIRKWAAEHPELAKNISGTILVAGGLITGIGTLLVIVPKLIEGFRLFRTAMAATTGQAALMGGALVALIGTLAYYIQLLGQVSVAESYVIEADKRLHDTQMKLIDKLSEAAVAAGWHYGQMSKLIDAYDGNIAALTRAIQKGEHGIEIQKALAEVGKQHNAVLEAQKKAQEEANEKMAAAARIAAEAKKVQEEWTNFLKDAGIQTAATAGEIQKYKNYAKDLSDLLAKGKITQDDYNKGMAKADEALDKYGLHLVNHLPKQRDFNKLIADMKPTFEQARYWGDQYDKVIENLGLKSLIQAKNETRLYLQQQKLLNEAWREGLISNEEYAKGMTDLQDKIRGTKDAHEEVIPEIRSGWEGLYNDIAQGWGNVVSESLKNDWGLRGFLRGVWAEMKDTFFTYVGEMISKWAVSFLDDILIKKTKQAAADAGSSITSTGSSLTGLATTAGSVATTIASILTTLATAIAAVIGTIVGAIAAGLVTMATAIASAATILAAAAPAIITVGAIAMGLYAVGSAINALFGGGGGKQTDVTYWLKMMWADGKELHDWIINLPEAYLNNFHNFFFNTEWATRETVNVLYAMKDFLGPMLDALNSIDAQIGKLRGAASGAISTQTEMLVVHGTPSVPEITMPLPGLKTLIAEGGPRNGNGGGAVILQAEFNVQAMDAESFRETIRTKIGPEIVEWIKTNVGKRLVAEALGV